MALSMYTVRAVRAQSLVVSSEEVAAPTSIYMEQAPVADWPEPIRLLGVRYAPVPMCGSAKRRLTARAPQARGPLVRPLPPVPAVCTAGNRVLRLQAWSHGRTLSAPSPAQRPEAPVRTVREARPRRTPRTPRQHGAAGAPAHLIRAPRASLTATGERAQIAARRAAMRLREGQRHSTRPVVLTSPTPRPILPIMITSHEDRTLLVGGTAAERAAMRAQGRILRIMQGECPCGRSAGLRGGARSSHQRACMRAWSHAG